MKINELMIGDWVEFLIDIVGGDTDTDTQIEQYQPMKVVSMSYGDVESEEGVNNDENQLRPIPITTEILQKFGFGYVETDINPYNNEVLSHFYLGEECYCANMDLHIGTYNSCVFWLNSSKVTIYGIRYVHELQHTLRLCGIDEEIEL